MTLKIDWATHEAAKYACENFHYSESIPVGKLVKVGAWENDKFIGVVIFGRGSNHNIGKPYNLEQIECIELVRIALTKHVSTVSKIMMLAIRFLKKQSKGIKLIVSYADPEQGHHGGVYQATNWIYVGVSGSSEKCLYKGKWVHKRTVDSMYGNHKGFTTKKVCGKYTYLMPLDNDMKQKLTKLSRPYPKRVSSIDSDAVSFQETEGSASLTDTLQKGGKDEKNT